MDFQLSAADFDAIAFFEEHAEQVANWGLLSVFGEERDDRRKFRKGERLVADGIAAAKRSERNQKWMPEEWDASAEAYHLFGVDRAKTIAHFRKVSGRHSDDAINLAMWSCVALDTESGQKGFTDHAQGLLDALNAITPGRFSSNRA